MNAMRALAILVVMLGLATSGAAQQLQLSESDREAAQSAFQAAYTSHEWSDAIRHGETLANADPDNPTYAYNLACVYALQDEQPSAFKWLAAAATRGFPSVWRLMTDPDLESIRSHNTFEKILARVQTNREQMVAELARQFRKRPPLIYLPPRYERDQRRPVIIALHGFGGTADALAPLWQPVAREFDAVLVVPQAIRKADDAGFDWGDIEEADALVQLTLSYVQRKHKIDPTRIVLTGFSQGAFIATNVGVRYPDQFCGVISIGGPYVQTLDAPRLTNAGRKPRFCFLAGSGDHRAKENRSAADDFRRAGYDSRFKEYPSIGHAFPEKPTEELREALKYVLGGS